MTDEPPYDPLDSSFPDFESFTAEGKEWPPYNNFHGFFCGNEGTISNVCYRESPVGRILRDTHPNLDAALVKQSTELINRGGNAYHPEWTQNIEPLLFIAYKILESHVMVQALLEKDRSALTR